VIPNAFTQLFVQMYSWHSSSSSQNYSALYAEFRSTFYLCC